CSFIVLRIPMIVVICSRFATGDTFGAAVAIRPLEGVDYACPPCSLTDIHGKGILPFRGRCPGRWHHGSLRTVIAPVDRVTTAPCGRPITERMGDGRLRHPSFRG